MGMTPMHRETGELVMTEKAWRREVARRIMQEDRRVLEMLAPYDGPVEQHDVAAQGAATTTDGAPRSEGRR